MDVNMQDVNKVYTYIYIYIYVHIDNDFRIRLTKDRPDLSSERAPE
jgi:hypothetical protein